MRAAFVRVFLALGLVFAAQGSLVHPLVHLDDAGLPVHRAAGQDTREGEEDGTGVLCDAIAALSACAHSAGGALATELEAGAPRARTARSRSGPSSALAYRSQAPPTALL